jgi:hypothetical protein
VETEGCARDVFPSLRTHRLICLFRLDMTPKRRPQVSHTKARAIAI